jgi:hypothetical protein
MQKGWGAGRATVGADRPRPSGRPRGLRGQSHHNRSLHPAASLPPSLPARRRASRNLLSCLSWWLSTCSCCTVRIASDRTVSLSVLGSLLGSTSCASSMNLRSRGRRRGAWAASPRSEAGGAAARRRPRARRATPRAGPQRRAGRAAPAPPHLSLIFSRLILSRLALVRAASEPGARPFLLRLPGSPSSSSDSSSLSPSSSCLAARLRALPLLVGSAAASAAARSAGPSGALGGRPSAPSHRKA